jgi:glycosyltransferase involved in cell wall biosynthesis
VIDLARPGVALVIPVLNEGEAIGDVVRAVPDEIVDEVIVVDGGSRDDTVARAQEAGAHVVIEPRSGYGAACLVGARSAAPACQVIAFMDGDGSDPEDLKAIVDPIISGEHDFVIGSRLRGTREPGSLGSHQALAGYVAGLAIRLLYGVRYTDMGPLRAIRRDALEALDMQERTYGWNVEMQMRAARAGLRILEVPVRHRRRAGGASKVARNLAGSAKAGCHIAATLARVALRLR